MHRVLDADQSLGTPAGVERLQHRVPQIMVQTCPGTAWHGTVCFAEIRRAKPNPKSLTRRKLPWPAHELTKLLQSNLLEPGGGRPALIFWPHSGAWQPTAAGYASNT